MHILFFPIFLQGAMRQFFSPMQLLYSFQYHFVQLAVSCFATALLNFTKSNSLGVSFGVGGTWIPFSTFRCSMGLICGFICTSFGKCSSSFHSLMFLHLISYQICVLGCISAYTLQTKDRIQSHKRIQNTCFEFIILFT